MLTNQRTIREHSPLGEQFAAAPRSVFAQGCARLYNRSAMRILVIGSGGREHAICWKLKQSPRASHLYCAPGHAGISKIATCVPVKVNDAASLAALAESIGADLTVIGPEAPLVAGVSEAFRARALRMVGPSANAAQLEGSKIFAKQFMARHGIPTARFKACDSPDQARAARKSEFEFPIVVKADGLAAGKGVRITSNEDEFDDAINAMMVEGVFGGAGSRVVLEECLFGREASLMIFTDGRDYKAIVPAQDYKRVSDGDRGPNTGGMGSFSTPGLIDDAMLARITREIVEPTLVGMASEGNPFSGILYTGLMFTSDGPRVIEYNARLGDPETQAVMTRLDSDLVEVFDSIIEARIGSTSITWSDDSSVCVVAASGGYPGEFEKGKPINGLDKAKGIDGAVVFHAGTALDDQGRFISSGGRVLGVTGRGNTLEEARGRTYQAMSLISFEGCHYRSDIAQNINS
ncbi:MAG TPA: phosphoribosylamine--glycine ligase [Blastocatellia bacterium]|nr:phosphoribosylamine--glycine ligase [Blastocatellia bacterium]